MINEKIISQDDFEQNGRPEFMLSEREKIILDIHYEDGISPYFIKIMTRQLKIQDGLLEMMQLCLLFVLFIKTKIQTTSYLRIFGNSLIDGLEEVVAEKQYNINPSMFVMLRKSIYGKKIGTCNYLDRYVAREKVKKQEEVNAIS